MTRSLWLRIVAPLVTALVVATGCGGGGGGNNQSNSGQLAADQTLNFPIFGDFGTLDPGQLNAETDSEIAQNIFDNVVIFDKNLKIVPDLASSWDVSSDGTQYTFHLRHDATFSNGDKVTSKDVLYSWNRAAALQGGYAGNFSAVVGYDKVSQNTKSGKDLETLLEANDPSVSMSGLTAPDPYTVVAKLTSPAGWWLSAIALESTTGAVVDVNAVKQDPDNWWTNASTLIGTGPYKVTSYVPKQSIDFEAVPNWWGSPKPTIKKVHIDILQNVTSGIQAYEQGKYDVVGYGGYSNLGVDNVIAVQNNPAVKSQLLLHPKVRSYWVSFNVTCDAKRAAGGPFCGDSAAAKAAREAFALSIDKNAVVSVVCKDIICKPITGGLIVKGLDGYLGDNQDPLSKFDASKAKQDLQTAEAAGLKFDNLTYYYDPNNPINGATATVLQDQWQTNLGIHVNLSAVDHSPFIKARLKGKYVLSRDGWQADYNNPQDWYDNLWGHVAGCPDSNCTSGYNNAQYNTTLDKADTETGSQALNDYDSLGKMLENDVVYIPLYYTVGAFLFKPYVKNAGTNNFFDNYWNTMAILKH